MKQLILAMCAAFFWGTAPILEKVGLAGMSPLTAVITRCVAVVAFGLLFAGIIHQPWVMSEQLSGLRSAVGISALTGKSVALLVVSGILSAFIGQMFYFSALRAGNASTVVPIASTYPLVVLILSLVFLKETVTITKAAGVLLIICGIWLIR
jgi:transporter family protein